jgi:hypothetical protein
MRLKSLLRLVEGVERSGHLLRYLELCFLEGLLPSYCYGLETPIETIKAIRLCMIPLIGLIIPET